jgi:hypothetical protein
MYVSIAVKIKSLGKLTTGMEKKTERWPIPHHKNLILLFSSAVIVVVGLSFSA